MTSTSLQDAWRTDRLQFRTVAETDYDWWFDEIDSDPVNQALASPFQLIPPRRKKPEEWLKSFSHSFDLVICLRADTQDDEPKEARLGLVPDTEKTPEKRIGFMNLAYGGPGRSPHNRAADFGITLTGPHQNKGYGTEAVRWALDWAFLRGNFHSVHLSSLEYNPRAHKCYEKCGFKLEGRIRQTIWFERKWYDCLEFGILEEEWEASRLREVKK